MGCGHEIIVENLTPVSIALEKTDFLNKNMGAKKKKKQKGGKSAKLRRKKEALDDLPWVGRFAAAMEPLRRPVFQDSTESCKICLDESRIIDFLKV